MSNLQRWTSRAKLGFWKKFQGPQQNPNISKTAEGFFFPPRRVNYPTFSRPHDYIEARAWPCTDAQELKKSKITKNGLKPTQTIIEVHIKEFWVGPGTVRYHMSQRKKV